ncbi:MAG: uL15 family ribosomal protein, partial [Acholeplasmataceae bacterium]|nr:uL15 family ribosomal protein [Acholeplasmataceae bacterium]
FENGAVVTPEVLLEKRIIRKLNDGVKVLANGTLEKSLTVKAHAFSKQALIAITEAGGTAEVI